MKRWTVFVALACSLMVGMITIVSCNSSPEEQISGPKVGEEAKQIVDQNDAMSITKLDELDEKVAYSADPCVIVGTPVSNEDESQICYQYQIIRIEDQKCVEEGYYYDSNPRLCESSPGAVLLEEDSEGSAPTQTHPPLVQFRVYETINYRGSVLWIYTDMKDLRKIPRGKGNWNDVISSVKVTNGEGRLYQHIKYAGRTLPIWPGEDYHDLTHYGFNNMTSSIKCYVTKSSSTRPNKP